MENQQLDDPNQSDDPISDWDCETPEQVPSPCRPDPVSSRRDNGVIDHGSDSPKRTKTDSTGTRLDADSYREGDWDLRVLLAPWLDPPEQRPVYNWVAEGNAHKWCTYQEVHTARAYRGWQRRILLIASRRASRQECRKEDTRGRVSTTPEPMWPGEPHQSAPPLRMSLRRRLCR